MSWRLMLAHTPLRNLCLLLSFAVMGAISLALLPMLSQSNWYWPAGVAARGDFATLGMRSAEDSFAPTTLRQLSLLRDSGYRARLAYYSESTLPLQEGERTRSSEVAFVSENLLELLDISIERGRTPQPDERAVLVSGKFARQQFGSIEAAAGRSLSLGERPVGFAVVGVLDERFVGLGRRQPDMLIDASQAPVFGEVKIAGIALSAQRQLAINKAVAAESTAYGILRLNSAQEIAGVAEQFAKERSRSYEVDLGGTKLSLGFAADAGLTPAVIQGIDLDPNRTVLISRYLRILAVVLLILACILAANFAMHLISRLPARLDEIKLRVVLGAQSLDLLWLMLGEQALLIPAAAVLAALLAAGGLEWIVMDSALSGYFTARVPKLDLTAAAATALLLVVVSIAATLVPYATVRQLASGAKTISQSASRRWLWSIAGAGLWALCFLALSVAVLIWTNTLRMRQVDYGTRDIVYAKIGADQSTTVAEFNARLEDPVNTAFADAMPLVALQRQAEFRLPNSNFERSFNAYEVNVSDNFFNVMDARLLAGENVDVRNPRAIVVSCSIAQLLGVAPEQLLGQTILRKSEQGPESSPEVISGVVSDIRYDALFGAAEAVIYRSGQARDAGTSRDGEVVTFVDPWKPGYAFSSEPDRVWLGKTIRPGGRLTGLLLTRIALETLLAAVVLFVTAVALLIMAVGLVAESVATVQGRKREWALYLSCGAGRGQLVTELLVTRVPSILFGVAVAMLGSWWLYDDVKVVLPFLSKTDGWRVVLCDTLFFGVLLTVLAGVAYHNMRPDLAMLLREER